MTILFLAVFSVLAADAKPAPVVLHVAPQGNDAWSGQSDRPLATLPGARDWVRRLKKAGPLPAGGVRVELHAGRYELAEPLELTAADSGTPAAPIVYQGPKGQPAVICGGRRVKDFRPVTDPAVLARLEPAACGKVLQADLRAQGITDYGRWARMYSAAVGISGVGIRVAHNLIHDAPHQAISFSGNDHLIELNEIHNVCYESNDAGAIYAGRNWTMRGTVIRYNYMHHLFGHEGRGCVGVYLDDMFCGTRIFGNVFYRVPRPAFIGGGRDCTVENNIFVECVPAIHVDARMLGWAGTPDSQEGMRRSLAAMPYQTPPWSQRYPELPKILDDEPATPKGNVIQRNVCWGGKWDGIQAKARPYVTLRDNLVGEDPHFVDAAKLNFQLRDDSLAYRKIGFQRIPVEKIGLEK